MNANQKKDAQLQELNVWLIGKRNEIRRKKDVIALEKNNTLIKFCDEYIKTKGEYIHYIYELRKQKAQFDIDDPRRFDLEDKARHNEHMLSLLRNEHERYIHMINNKHMRDRMELDDEDRKLTADYEQQKNAIMLEYMNAKDESRASDPEHQAE